MNFRLDPSNTHWMEMNKKRVNDKNKCADYFINFSRHRKLMDR